MQLTVSIIHTAKSCLVPQTNIVWLKCKLHHLIFGFDCKIIYIVNFTTTCMNFISKLSL